jgi:hypothetical protein
LQIRTRVRITRGNLGRGEQSKGLAGNRHAQQIGKRLPIAEQSIFLIPGFSYHEQRIFKKCGFLCPPAARSSGDFP